MSSFALSFHARWRCGRSGACCTSGWPIPVERETWAGLQRALDERRLGVRAPRAELFVAGAGLPEGTPALLGTDARGHCLFFEPGRPHACAIHRQLGHDALPVSCRQFPRVCLHEPRGVSITLSHYCPTAAALLFAEGPVAIVADPEAFPAPGAYEGLDARAALPPLLRPDALLDWESHAAFERQAVRRLAAGGAVEPALEELAGQAERLRAWRAGEGPLGALVERVLAAPAGVPAWARRAPRALLAEVAACLVHAPGALLATRDAEAHDERWVAPAWSVLAEPIGRYLAARAFASWCAHQGRGLRTRVLHLLACRAVLRVQAARLCGAAGRPLDAALLLEAVRAADLLLLHLTSPEELAARLSSVEQAAA